MLTAILIPTLIYTLWLCRSYAHTNPTICRAVRVSAAVISFPFAVALSCLALEDIRITLSHTQQTTSANDAEKVTRMVEALGGTANYLRYLELQKSTADN